ncbi:DMT family transporter [Scopulibacillus darangshiensis]|uniref:DMT family transporter n=1 Tax=Scopulibacillus darangshiensis TaxID=442528 RepID=UPI001042FD41|nr:multidrug resistance efflux transporter family protein [Scopulibacillus darangshiensis]
MKAFILGILASFFFAFTFILNRSMEISGGSWLWSASLRFIFMVPFLFIIVSFRRNIMPLLKGMVKNPLPWVIWSFFGFVLFYAPITFAAAYGPGWLTAGTWQLTIIAGMLLSPLFYEWRQTADGLIKTRQSLALKPLAASSIIIIGVALMQGNNIHGLSWHLIVTSMLPVIVAAFSYPLGNRKMMEACNGEFDTYQRVLGMTLGSLPFWIIMAIIGWVKTGPPSSGQLTQTFIVAICSGVIATVLFFMATDMVRTEPHKLAAVEATQSGEVIFTLLGEIVLLSGNIPSLLSLTGLFLIIAGMIVNSFVSSQPNSTQKRKKSRTA